ncbi:MAG: hypothetical protein Q7P63_12430 [Verrucomicrobiota bacterium JB022]|nr:hypothetical protein [Verrucomicrobiota bacterium JB022]
MVGAIGLEPNAENSQNVEVEIELDVNSPQRGGIWGVINKEGEFCGSCGASFDSSIAPFLEFWPTVPERERRQIIELLKQSDFHARVREEGEAAHEG